MFTDRNMIEQKQERCLRDDSPFNIDNPVWSSPTCAWCLFEQKLPAGEGSHGICREHANQILLQQRKLRSSNRRRSQTTGV
jgi:hypothetical protein